MRATPFLGAFYKAGKKNNFGANFAIFFAIGKTLFILHGLKAARHDYEYTVKSFKIGHQVQNRQYQTTKVHNFDKSPQFLPKSTIFTKFRVLSPNGTGRDI